MRRGVIASFGKRGRDKKRQYLKRWEGEEREGKENVFMISVKENKRLMYRQNTGSLLHHPSLRNKCVSLCVFTSVLSIFC